MFVHLLYIQSGAVQVYFCLFYNYSRIVDVLCLQEILPVLVLYHARASVPGSRPSSSLVSVSLPGLSSSSRSPAAALFNDARLTTSHTSIEIIPATAATLSLHYAFQLLL